MNLRGTSFREGLKLLFQSSGLNVVVDPAVPDPVLTVEVHDVPFDQALRLLLRIASAASHREITYTAREGLYTITFREEMAVDAVLLEKIPLNYLRVADVVGQLNRALGSPNVSVEAATRENSLIARGAADDLAQLKQLVRLLDVPQPVLTITVGIRGPGTNGRPLALQSLARALAGRHVTIDEQAPAGAQGAHLKVQLDPVVQGDGDVLVDSDWDVSVPLAGGPRGPVRLVKRLTTTTRARPGEATAVAEIDAASWGGRGKVVLWLKVEVRSLLERR
jgi:hypothetical protein